MEYSFFVEGHPEPQARPRFSVRKDRYGRATGVNARDSEKSRSYKERVYACALTAYRRGASVMLTGPLGLRVVVFREIPLSFSKKKRREAEEGRIFPVQRPDLDNYIKAALDGVGMKGFPKIIFSDDAQIVHITAEKRYSSNGHVGMAIEIKELMPAVARGNLDFERGNESD